MLVLSFILLMINPAWAGRLADLIVVDSVTGQTLPIYNHRGKMYVAGEAGREYNLIVKNKTPGKVLAIVSIDGLNVINGRNASFDSPGYVVDHHSRVNIAGWRKNMSEVAKFYFTYPEDSLAARTNRGQNMGVIGVAIFKEKQPEIYLEGPQGLSMEKRQNAAPGAARSDLGTGHGTIEHAPARRTEFEKESSRPQEVISIYYESRASLIKKGIIKVDCTPSPFVELNNCYY